MAWQDFPGLVGGGWLRSWSLCIRWLKNAKIKAKLRQLGLAVGLAWKFECGPTRLYWFTLLMHLFDKILSGVRFTHLSSQGPRLIDNVALENFNNIGF